MKKITTKMAGIRLGITLFFILLIASIGHAQSSFATNELIIRFEDGTSAGYIDSVRQEYNAVEDITVSPSPYSNVRLWRITQFPAGENNNLNDINEINGHARGRARVQSVGLNYHTELFSFNNPNDPGNNIVDPTILCENDFTITCPDSSASTKIAILDTGIGFTFDEIIGNIFSDHALFDSYYGPTVGYDFVNDDALPQDDHGHGTHIAGIIAQISELAGANTIELLSYKTHDHTGTGDIYDIILGVDHAIMNGANIINMSFRYQAPPPSVVVEPLEFVIHEARDAGILVVAAAGNDGLNNDLFNFPSFPASFASSNILSVASADCAKGLSSFSNMGMQSVDIATLGENVVAPDHTGDYVIKSGTSQSTAITTGIAGLLATSLINIHWDPLKCSIINSAEYSSSLNNLMNTSGIVNAGDAYLSIMGSCGVGYRSESDSAPEENLFINEVSVFPNPFSEFCQVECQIESAGEVGMSIYNELGQLVYFTQKELMSGTHTFVWDTANTISNGVYFVRIQMNDEILIRKMIKQN